MKRTKFSKPKPSENKKKKKKREKNFPNSGVCSLDWPLRKIKVNEKIDKYLHLAMENESNDNTTF